MDLISRAARPPVSSSPHFIATSYKPQWHTYARGTKPCTHPTLQAYVCGKIRKLPCSKHRDSRLTAALATSGSARNPSTKPNGLVCSLGPGSRSTAQCFGFRTAHMKVLQAEGSSLSALVKNLSPLAQLISAFSART